MVSTWDNHQTGSPTGPVPDTAPVDTDDEATALASGDEPSTVLPGNED